MRKKKKHEKREKHKKKKKKNAPQKDLCRKKAFDTPNSIDLGSFSRRHFYPEEKENKKKAAVPTLLCQPCFGNPFLPTLLCHPCFANPAWRTLIFRSIIFSKLLKGAGWGIREVLSMFFFVFLCFLFLCFSVFFLCFLCVFYVFCVFSMFFMCFSVFLLPLEP